MFFWQIETQLEKAEALKFSIHSGFHCLIKMVVFQLLALSCVNYP